MILLGKFITLLIKERSELNFFTIFPFLFESIKQLKNFISYFFKLSFRFEKNSNIFLGGIKKGKVDN
jgi:hypothetical protein